MKVRITSEHIARVPSTVVDKLICKGLSNRMSNDETDSLLKIQETRIRSAYQKDTFTQDEQITD